MNQHLKISINNATVLEYDKNIRLPGKRRRFLDMMDSDMKAGIIIGGDLIEYPNQNQRAKYVAMNLVDGLLKKDDTLVSITCAYLGNRVPDLEEIRVHENGDDISMELIQK